MSGGPSGQLSLSNVIKAARSLAVETEATFLHDNPI
jgi:hypothetical protein